MGRNGAGKSTLLRLAAGLSSRRVAGSSAAAASRCCCSTPATTSSPSAWGRSCPRTRSRPPGSRARRSPSARPLRRRAPAARAGDRAPGRRSCRRLPRRADARHGPRPQADLAAHLRELAERGARCSSRPTTRSSPPTGRSGPSCSATARVADAPTIEVLGGGWYFATQTARILGGGALLPEEGAALPATPRARRRSPRELARRLLLVLGLALVAGFAWYERSHPSARVLALVATLAALAALGGIAFAPLPDVKPTTDIVLLTGYALGARPGSRSARCGARQQRVLRAGPVDAVADVRVGRGRRAGACSPARSGASSGARPRDRLRARGRRLRRRHEPPPVGDLLGRPQPGQARRILATSLPFDIAHVVGNVVFCLVFGPALVRALTRYRERFEVTWRPVPALAASTLAAVVLLAAAPRPPRPRRRSSGCRARRTATAASVATPASARPPSIRAGPGSAWRPPGATRATPSAAGATSSPTSAPTRRGTALTSATRPAPSSSSGPQVWRRRPAAVTS